ncbi:MAG: hypothetical protein IKJ33_04255 [Clostridia bacterium]|nr:hypothetical protein [Clostridia bacterium]
MKKFYESLMWTTMITIILDLLCSCLNWKVASIVVSIVLIILVILMVTIYTCFVKYKCQKCGTVFKGKKVEMFFAPHTPTKRYMRCPVCNQKMWCDDYFESKKEKDRVTKEDL